ncbi:MAG: glycoside hydrolase family 130 protein [Clostridia bacterium]|nr:glycoside hydrolase family 130 protein [Clostridia bacterium]
MSEYKSSPVIHKLDKPILTASDIPYEASLIFNAGVIKHNGKYVMIFRNDYGCTQEEFENEGKFFTGTSVGVAISDNGVDNWVVMDKPLIDSKDYAGTEISRLYDPRIMKIEGQLYLCLAMDTKHGLRGVIATLSETLDSFEILSATAPDNRNMVLFPEKINGMYCRLERPMPVYSRGRDRFDTWFSDSPDLRYWGNTQLVFGVEDVPFANDKVGPAAPPIKTDKGWLTLIHAVDRDESRGKNGWEASWKKRYAAGIMLLDLEDPTKVIGISKKPLIAADLPYENEGGFRQDVIFPCGMVLEDDGEVKLYYGASDTVTCLATADVNDLIALCLE